MFPAFILGAIGASQNGVVTLSGEGIQAGDPSSPFEASVGIRFNTDGTVEKGTADATTTITWTQIDAATDWIFPNDYANGTYEVRYTNRVGTPDFTTKAAAEDTFVDLTTQRVWIWNETTSGNKSFTCDFEIRDATGTVVASANYSFNILNTP